MRVGTKLSANFEAVVHLTEPEMRALDALVSYGIEPFLKTFKTELGSGLLGHEDGIRVLFESVAKQVRPSLARMDEVQALLKMEISSGGKLS